MEVSSWENHLFLWAIYTMANCNSHNQSVLSITSRLGFAFAEKRPPNLESYNDWMFLASIPPGFRWISLSPPQKQVTNHQPIICYQLH